MSEETPIVDRGTDVLAATAPPTATDGPLRRRRWGRVQRVCELLLLATYVLRYLFRDAYPGLSILYYITPGAVMLCLGLFVLTLSALARRNRGFWVFACMVLAARWYISDWKISHASAIDGDNPNISILFWNIARTRDLAPIAEYINSVDADIVAFVEAGPANEDRRNFWSTNCPDYDASLLGGGIQLLVKGESGDTWPEVIGPGSISRTIPVEVRGQKLNLIIADVCSYPHYSRAEPLANVARLAEELADEAVVVMGDFNTPPDSVHFRPLRERHLQAFEAAGSGYAPTWPLPVPVLELDQTWINGRMRPVECRHLWTTLSDHRPVLTKVVRREAGLMRMDRNP